MIGHGDAERRELGVERLRDALDARTSSSNRCRSPRPTGSRRRDEKFRDVAGALLAAAAEHGARDREQTEHVGLVDAPHLVARRLLDRADDAVAGVVHQDVDPAEPCDGRLDRAATDASSVTSSATGCSASGRPEAAP